MKRFGLVLIAAVATGFLLTLALPLGEQGWLMGFALVPLLIATRAKGGLMGFLAGLVAVFAAAWISTTGWLYAETATGDSTWVYGSFGKYGMSFAIAFALWGDAGTRRWPSWCFAALGVLLEAAQLLQLPSHLALSQYRHAGMVQLSSVGGIWLVSFLLWWANFALAEWWVDGHRMDRRLLWAPGLGVVYLSTTNLWLPWYGDTRRLGAVQARLEEHALLSDYAEASRSGATLVVWPNRRALPS
ncbi:hypothetical protein BH11ARM2_BH11ARM2_27230 [soil metagenome]